MAHSEGNFPAGRGAPGTPLTPLVPEWTDAQPRDLSPALSATLPEDTPRPIPVPQTPSEAFAEQQSLAKNSKAETRDALYWRPGSIISMLRKTELCQDEALLWRQSCFC